MEYDPHGSELLDIVAHYLKSQKGKHAYPRIWCKSICKGIDDAKCDTDLFVLLTQLTTEGSPVEREQAEELAHSMVTSERV